MAIQFACPACQQPIEVDDEWANQTVSCPYCRRIVRAPAQSTLQFGEVRTASQPGVNGMARAPGTFANSPPPPPPGTYAAPRPAYDAVGVPLAPDATGGSLGNLALVCGIVAWVIMVVAAAMMVPTFRRVLDAVSTTMPSGARVSERELTRQLQERMHEYVLKDAATRRSMLSALLAVVVSEVFGLTGLILGIVGMTRSRLRRGTAVAGLVASATFLLGQCGFFLLAALSGG